MNEWITDYAKSLNLTVEALMGAAHAYVARQDVPLFDDLTLDPDFWSHYDAVTGR